MPKQQRHGRRDGHSVSAISHTAKCFVTLLERFSVDTRETARDRRIDRLSDQIRRLTARIVDRSLNAEGPAEEIAALMERRDLLEKRRQRLLARTNPST
jgi:hypothetical protein